MLFCYKISLLYVLRYFVSKSVLSRFAYFGVEKIGPKILSVEKKGQISGMFASCEFEFKFNQQDGLRHILSGECGDQDHGD